MDHRHFEIALISVFVGALLAGADAGVQAVPANGTINVQSVVTIGILAFLTTLLASLKSLYQDNPNAPKDGLLAVMDGLQPVLAQVLVNLLGPKPARPAPVAPTPATPAVLFQPRPVAAVGQAVAPVAATTGAVSTDVPTQP